jgi:hypothetical protein
VTNYYELGDGVVDGKDKELKGSMVWMTPRWWNKNLFDRTAIMFSGEPRRDIESRQIERIEIMKQTNSRSVRRGVLPL